MLLASLSLLTWGCTEKLEGPSPVVEPPSETAEPPPVDPGIICRDLGSQALLATGTPRGVSSVVINGAGFSPVPIDVPDDPRTAIPTVTLTHGQTLDGDPGDLTETVYNGDPDIPLNVPLLSWQSRSQMTFEVMPRCDEQHVCPTGYVCNAAAGVCTPEYAPDAELSGILAEGIYNVTVTNANTDTVTTDGSLAVIGRPTMPTSNALSPPIVCLAQGDRQVTISGTRFLKINNARANVTIGENTTPFEFDQGGMAQCTAIPHPGYSALEQCTEATMTLATDSVPVGYPAITVNNPETAACVTEEVINLRVVPPPTINAIAEINEPQDAVVDGDGTIVCTTDGMREVILHGIDFLEIDGAIPTVTLDGTSVVTKNIAGCEELPTMDLTVRRCTQLTVEIPVELAAVDDPYQPDVVITNPDPAGCTDSTSTNGRINLLTIAPPPDLQNVAPPLICLAQSDRTVVLEGRNYLTIDGAEPAISFDTLNVDPANIEPLECGALDVANKDVDRCNDLQVTLLQGSLEPGQPTISVTNPMPAGCNDTEDGLLTVVPPPTILAVAEVGEDQTAVADGDGTIVCTSEGDRSVVIHGTDFLDVDGTLPTVTLDSMDVTSSSVGGCEPLTVNGLTVQKCTQLTIVVPQSMAATTDPYQPLIEVTNPPPAGCNDSTADQLNLLTIAPPPDVIEVIPPLVCIEDGDRQVVIAGTDFLTIDGTTPSVDFLNAGGTEAQPSAITGQQCVAVDVGGKTVQRCTELLVTIAQNSVDLGEPVVEVTNPMPAGCSDIGTGLITVVEGPEVTSATPALVCTDDSARTIVLTGTGFLSVDGSLPSVTMDGTEVTTDSLGNCTAISVNGLTVEQCTELTVTAAQGSLVAGDTLVTVTNVDPAGCSVTNDVVVTVPPAVAINSVNPIGFCVGTASQETLTISGTGFLNVGGTPFELTIDGVVVTPDSVSDCTDLTVDGLAAQSCNTIVATFDFNGFPAGTVPIGVSNPDPSGCSFVATDAFQLSPPPTVTEVQPAELCSDTANDSVTLIGTDFATNVSVVLTGNNVGEIPQSAVTVTWVSDTQVDLAFADGLPADTYSITASNGQNCDTTLTAGLVVNPTPLVFFIDPPVVYNGITTEVTVYATGLEELVATVELIDDQGTVTQLTTFSNPDPTKPNRVAAEVPDGLTPGTYEVSVTSADNCISSLNGELVITDSLSLDIAEIDPPYASPTNPTPVTVTSTDPAPAGFVNFVPVPRVYLTPKDDPNATATAVRATILEEPAVAGDPYVTLNGIITPPPGGLLPGVYNLIVVNPTGEVGLLDDAITITAAEPPFVTSLGPATVDSNTANQTVEINGQNFTADDVNTSVTFDCVLFADGSDAPVDATGTVTTATPTKLTVSVDTSGVSAGTICIVTVTNPDGASYNFSALSVKEPAQNLNPWSSGPELNEARRAAGTAAGRPTDRSRFLYAIGGDDNTLAGAKTTVEDSAIGVYGGMGSWTLQRNDLSNAWDNDAGATASLPRTFGEAVRIRNFIYLTGGHDGTASQNTVLRAQVLRPQDGPEIVALDAALGDSTAGVGAGVWYYRVSAVFPTDDPSNPGGESLPGEVQAVQLPDIPELLILTLNWEAVPGASGYRIYRTPVADDVPTNLQLIGETTGNGATSLTEDGLTADPAETPFRQGSLGVWHTVSAMQVPRSAHASVVVQNPGNPLEYYLYAAGGRDGGGSVTDSIEYATITVDPTTGEQTVGTWGNTTATLGTARAELGGFTATESDTPVIASGVTWVYFSQGRTNGNTTNAFGVGQVDFSAGNEGDIAAINGFGGPTPARAGATDLQANGWLFILGGANGNPSNGNDTSTQLTGTGATHGTWDALGGGSMLEPRIFMGSTAESAFFFIVGGSSGTAALSTVEQTIQ